MFPGLYDAVIQIPERTYIRLRAQTSFARTGYRDVEVLSRWKWWRVLRLVFIGAGVVVALLVLALVATLLVRRAVRRAGRRMGSWLWRLFELRANVLPPGPRRDAARLRCRLDSELRATTDMLRRAPQGLIFRADATALLGDLNAAARELDGELAAIERFLDPAQQRAALAAIAGQVDQVIATTYAARQTILRTAAEDRIRHLAALRDNVDVQAAALDHYQRERGQLRL